MLKACLSVAFFCLVFVLPLRAFDWETSTVNGRDYVSLQSFCRFYAFGYQSPLGNSRFDTRNAGHSLSFKLGGSDLWLDGVHYVMSFPIENGGHDWLVSRMDVIKLFEPILRPTEISGRHAIRGVVIDPGHGGSDNGATSRLGAEKNYTLKTAFILEGLFKDAGLKTVLTRRTDVFVDLYERAHIASLYPDYAFVSIHYNSASPEARGLETYCLSPRGAASTSSAYLTRGDIQKLPGNDYDPQNILLASLVHSEIIKLNPGDSSADRGVKRARFVVIKQNVLPAILVEGGFVSNHMEAARVDRDDYRQSLAKAIARGVLRFINVMGNKNLQLPGLNSDREPLSVTPVNPIPVAPPAPSGFAHDTVNAKTAVPANPAPLATSATSAAAASTATAGVANAAAKPGKKSKKAKGKVAAVPSAPALVPPAAPTSEPGPSMAPASVSANPAVPSPDFIAPTSPAPTPAANQSAPTPSDAPMELREPAPPTPTPGADKAPAEPDEPPTVNIYPTAPAANAPKETPAAPAKAPSPAPVPAPPAEPSVSPAPAEVPHSPSTNAPAASPSVGE